MGGSTKNNYPEEGLPGSDARISGEIGSSEIATRIDEIARSMRASTGQEHQSKSSGASLGDFAKKLLKWRDSIDNCFAFQGLSASPAWCILLDLFVASQEGRLLTVSDASMSGSTAPTTGLRWVHVLEQMELIFRQHDPSDARRTYLRLCGETEAKISYLLATFRH